MKKSILEIYALAVCFFCVSGFVLSLAIAAYHVIAITRPEFTINSLPYMKHQSNDAYWREALLVRYYKPGETRKDRPSETELTKEREESFTRELNVERRNSSQTLVKCVVVMLVNLLCFVPHLIVARHAQKTSLSDSRIGISN